MALESMINYLTLSLTSNNEYITWTPCEKKASLIFYSLLEMMTAVMQYLKAVKLLRIWLINVPEKTCLQYDSQENVKNRLNWNLVRHRIISIGLFIGNKHVISLLSLKVTSSSLYYCTENKKTNLQSIILHYKYKSNYKKWTTIILIKQRCTA